MQTNSSHCFAGWARAADLQARQFLQMGSRAADPASEQACMHHASTKETIDSVACSWQATVLDELPAACVHSAHSAFGGHPVLYKHIGLQRGCIAMQCCVHAHAHMSTHLLRKSCIVDLASRWSARSFFHLEVEQYAIAIRLSTGTAPCLTQPCPIARGSAKPKTLHLMDMGRPIYNYMYRPFPTCSYTCLRQLCKQSFRGLLL